MKKRIFAFILCLAMFASTASLFASAVPYAPPATAAKDFGQENVYFYEVKKGEAAPRQDGYITESDGYGDPVSTYAIRYTTTADRVVYQEDLSPRPEYRLTDSGDYYVFPTPDSPDEVWKSIKAVETDENQAFFIYGHYTIPTSFSATATYYYYNPSTKAFATAYQVTAENFSEQYYAISSRTMKFAVKDWELLTSKPADWETNWGAYFFTTGGTYSKLSAYSSLSSSTAPAWEEGKYYNSSNTLVTAEPANWQYNWKNYKTKSNAPTWKESAYFEKVGDNYVLTTSQPANWADNFSDYYYKTEISWYSLEGGEKAPEWKENTYYSGTATKLPTYVILKSTALTSKPADWETNWKKYYARRSSTSTTYDALLSKTAPAFEPGIYFACERIASALYTNVESSDSAAASVTQLTQNHVVLPEKVNVYARYDGKYLYHAIEVVEAKHVNARYNAELRYSTVMSDSIYTTMVGTNFAIHYRLNLDSNTPTAVKSTLCRTAFNATTTLTTDGYQAGVINKYGNPEATAITDVIKPGSWFNIKHQTYAQTHPATTTPAETTNDEPSWDQPADQTSSGSGSQDDTSSAKQSGTYGTTVYEYKQLWSVINALYNGTGTPVPEAFCTFTAIQLENTLGNDAFHCRIDVPRATRHLPGGLSRTTGGNYSTTRYALRYPNDAGLTTGAGFGTYRFHWANFSAGYDAFVKDYLITDYYSLNNKKRTDATYLLPVWYPSGEEIDSKYIKPAISGVQIRSNPDEDQGFRMFIDVPITSESIEEIGVIIAPSEVVRRGQLKLGMKSVNYYSEDFATYYGIVDGKWVNLTENTDRYFSASATPNDADSFLTTDLVGGKLSGVYEVKTVTADLEKPYAEARKYTTYVASLTGLTDGFDDYFTFYTMRPYIKYSDGTVAYGPHEYKSVYYIACWSIQQILSEYNEAMTLTSASTRYTMDQMYLVAAKDATGQSLLDTDGNPIYVNSTTTSSSMSLYSGAGEHSIYDDYERETVFLWYAVRTLNKINKTSLRVENYEDFESDAKAIIERYMEQYEYIWQCIANCEAKTYIVER